MCGESMWLAGALEKIERPARTTVNPDAERNPATAHMFIINPLNGAAGGQSFFTRPSISSRIVRLRAMTGGGAASPAGPWGAMGS